MSKIKVRACYWPPRNCPVGGVGTEWFESIKEVYASLADLAETPNKVEFLFADFDPDEGFEIMAELDPIEFAPGDPDGRNPYKTYEAV